MSARVGCARSEQPLHPPQTRHARQRHLLSSRLLPWRDNPQFNLNGSNNNVERNEFNPSQHMAKVQVTIHNGRDINFVTFLTRNLWHYACSLFLVPNLLGMMSNTGFVPRIPYMVTDGLVEKVEELRGNSGVLFQGWCCCYGKRQGWQSEYLSGSHWLLSDLN